MITKLDYILDTQSTEYTKETFPKGHHSQAILNMDLNLWYAYI